MLENFIFPEPKDELKVKTVHCLVSLNEIFPIVGWGQ
jgi:hypothetical protein